jgi:hypothetical protein
MTKTKNNVHLKPLTGDEASGGCGCSPQLTPFAETPLSEGSACCGPGPEAGDPHERAGYEIGHYVETFMDTPAGQVPVLKASLGWRDRAGTLMVRLGIRRDNYRIAPGLYAIGTPGKNSPVLVTANYKLTVDTLRSHLSSASAWLLVLETLGINVWCAAGKGTFSTAELTGRIQSSRLEQVVSHKKIVLPQLGATGVSGPAIKRQTGFEVAWGPIRAEDITAFLDAGMRATEQMRMVTFSLWERIILIPVELSIVFKYLLWVCLAALILSGFGPGWFDFGQSMSRGAMILAACLSGIVAGCMLTPALLPWLPGREFAVKGAIAGLATVSVPILAVAGRINIIEAAAMAVCAISLSSFLAMNFTGATPFTSPSGVEREMRRAIPFQIVGIAAVLIGWVGAAFV